MYELYVSLRTFLRFDFLSASPPGALFFAVFLAEESAGVLAGALEATLEAGAFQAVEAGYERIANFGQIHFRRVTMTKIYLRGHCEKLDI